MIIIVKIEIGNSIHQKKTAQNAKQHSILSLFSSTFHRLLLNPVLLLRSLINKFHKLIQFRSNNDLGTTVTLLTLF